MYKIFKFVTESVYSCISLEIVQAYRLEPLLSPVYTQVKPVRMDSSGSGVSQNMVDHASGPRTQETTSTKKGGFFSSMFGSRNTSLVAKEPPPDKVVVCSACTCICLILYEMLNCVVLTVARNNGFQVCVVCVVAMVMLISRIVIVWGRGAVPFYSKCTKWTLAPLPSACRSLMMILPFRPRVVSRNV